MTKGKKIELRLTEEEKSSWSASAARRGLSLSDYIREEMNRVSGHVVDTFVPVRGTKDGLPSLLIPKPGEKPLSRRWKCKCGVANFGPKCTRCGKISHVEEESADPVEGEPDVV